MEIKQQEIDWNGEKERNFRWSWKEILLVDEIHQSIIRRIYGATTIRSAGNGDAWEMVTN